MAKRVAFFFPSYSQSSASKFGENLYTRFLIVTGVRRSLGDTQKFYKKQSYALSLTAIWWPLSAFSCLNW